MTSVTTDRINGLTSGVAIKSPVACATTANITLSGEQTIDGVTTSSSRVLVKDQTDTTENGIYLSSSGTWTREPDFNGERDVVTGTTVFVVGGTANGGEYWYVSTSGDPDPGDAMAFTQAPIAAAGVTLGTIATQNANSVAITGGSVTGITDITVADGGTGASSHTDDAILTGNGTAAITSNTVSLSTLGAIAGYRSTIVSSTATSITLSATTHGGRTLVTTSTAAVTLTLPNSLGAGVCTKVIQAGAGQVTCSVSTGATLQNRQTHTKTAGQYAAIVLEVRSNTNGTSAIYSLAGDTAA